MTDGLFPIRLRSGKGKPKELLAKFMRTRRRHGFSRGQALVEYILMSLVLLFLFVGMYRLLLGQLRILFTKAGLAILNAYF